MSDQTIFRINFATETVELDSRFSREWDRSDAVKLILQDSFLLPFFTDHPFRLTSSDQLLSLFT